MIDTKERIMKAARQLFEVNGFAATTTKEIAKNAGVSEVTLFRHFETKRNLFEQTVHSSLHPYKLEDYLENEAKYDLDADLRIIAKNMRSTLEDNIPLMKMVFKDRMKLSLSKSNLKHHEKKAKHSLEKYFEQMHDMGRINVDPKKAMYFFMNNISGYIAKRVFELDGHMHRDSYVDAEYFDWMIVTGYFCTKELINKLERETHEKAIKIFKTV